MRKLLPRTLIAAGAAAAAIGLSATSAFAAGWTVTGGPNFTATAGTTTLTVHHGSSTVTLTCTSARAAGNVTDGIGLPGAGIVRITSATFTSCTLGGILSFTVTASASSTTPWLVNANTFSSPVVSGTISAIHAVITGTGCTATVDGTAQNARNGTVNATYNNGTRALSVLNTGGNLHLFGVSGCLGLIATGDSANFAGTYTVTGSPVNPIQITPTP